MMESDALDHACLCGKQFPLRGALKNHQRGCQRAKKRLSWALTKAKEAWTPRKRMRAKGPEPEHDGHQAFGLAGSDVDCGADVSGL